LKEIGLDYPAVFYITQAPPQSMTWLSMEDAGRLGIQVTLLESPASRPRAAESPSRPSDVQMKNRALSIVAAIFRKWSESRETEWLENIYAERVSYYGSVKDRDEVVADKIRFAEHWPERRFRMRFETFAIECNDAAQRCKVEGIVDWQMHSPERSESRTGATTFGYVIAFGRDSFRIVAENGALVRRETERRDEPLQPPERTTESDSEEVRHGDE
jgi:hypothetical protein